MALTSDRLKNKLLLFNDASDSNFEGFPTTREKARDKWATAFDDYIAKIEEKIPRPPPPPDSHSSIDLTGVKDSFFQKVTLTPTGVAQTAALDFADAWQAGIGAITAGTTAVDSTGVTYKLFTKFVNVSTLHDGLVTDLAKLFSTPTTDVKTRIGDIASAFHTATKGLQAMVTKQLVNGTTSPFTMDVQ
jgi:hypothetical protein